MARFGCVPNGHSAGNYPAYATTALLITRCDSERPIPLGGKQIVYEQAEFC